MPVNVNDLKKHVSDSPLEIETARESVAMAARELLDVVLPPHGSLNPRYLVPTYHIAAEAEARQFSRDMRDLTRTGNEERQRLREEFQQLRNEEDLRAKRAATAAGKERLWQVIIGVSLAIVSWLLGALSAGQVFSHLLRP